MIQKGSGKLQKMSYPMVAHSSATTCAARAAEMPRVAIGFKFIVAE